MSWAEAVADYSGFPDSDGRASDNHALALANLLLEEAGRFDLEPRLEGLGIDNPWVRLGAASNLVELGLIAGPEKAVLPRGSVWKFLDDGSDQGTDWYQPQFDDNIWKGGAALLGYGDDPVTEIGFGDNPRNKHITTYFRKEFDLAEAGQPVVELLVRLRCDDGAVVYLNGAEIVRDNLPADTPIKFRTFAIGSVGSAEELMFDEFSVPAAALRRGRNVLAVEVHQNSPRSSDLGFDLELSAVTRPPAAALAQLEEAQKNLKQEALRILQDPPPASASALAEFYEATTGQ